MHASPHSLRLLTAATVALLMTGCATQTHRAPVEDRARSGTSAPTVSAAPVRVLPGAEHAGKPGYYTVRSGDTLIRVALESGQNWRDVALWNNLDNPNLIEVGQVLRVVPPEGASAAPAVTAKPVVPASRIESRPLDAKPANAAVTGGVAATTKPAATVAAAPTAPATSAAMTAASGAAASSSPNAAPVAASPTAPFAEAKDKEADEPAWAWPAAAPVVAGFEEGKRKGMVFGGKAGDPVMAAADGRVVYAGSGLRGYGNLVIIKHNANYLTAYAHNQSLNVKEDQVVRKGQKIAEMGSTDADRVQLHFEIRKQGKPVDPSKSLPGR